MKLFEMYSQKYHSIDIFTGVTKKKLTFTVDGLTIIQSFPADIAKFPLVMERFRPTVSYRIL